MGAPGSSVRQTVCLLAARSWPQPRTSAYSRFLEQNLQCRRYCILAAAIPAAIGLCVLSWSAFEKFALFMAAAHSVYARQTGMYTVANFAIPVYAGRTI